MLFVYWQLFLSNSADSTDNNNNVKDSDNKNSIQRTWQLSNTKIWFWETTMWERNSKDMIKTNFLWLRRAKLFLLYFQQEIEIVECLSYKVVRGRGICSIRTIICGDFSDPKIECKFGRKHHNFRCCVSINCYFPSNFLLKVLKAPRCKSTTKAVCCISWWWSKMFGGNRPTQRFSLLLLDEVCAVCSCLGRSVCYLIVPEMKFSIATNLHLYRENITLKTTVRFIILRPVETLMSKWWKSMFYTVLILHCHEHFRLLCMYLFRFALLLHLCMRLASLCVCAVCLSACADLYVQTLGEWKEDWSCVVEV